MITHLVPNLYFFVKNLPGQSDISQVFEVDDILKVSIVSQVEHHLYFPESFLCTLCMSPITSIEQILDAVLWLVEPMARRDTGFKKVGFLILSSIWHPASNIAEPRRFEAKLHYS